MQALVDGLEGQRTTADVHRPGTESVATAKAQARQCRQHLAHIVFGQIERNIQRALGLRRWGAIVQIGMVWVLAGVGHFFTGSAHGQTPAIPMRQRFVQVKIRRLWFLRGCAGQSAFAVDTRVGLERGTQYVWLRALTGHACAVAFFSLAQRAPVGPRYIGQHIQPQAAHQVFGKQYGLAAELGIEFGCACASPRKSPCPARVHQGHARTAQCRQLGALHISACALQIDQVPHIVHKLDGCAVHVHLHGGVVSLRQIDKTVFQTAGIFCRAKNACTLRKPVTGNRPDLVNRRHSLGCLRPLGLYAEAGLLPHIGRDKVRRQSARQLEHQTKATQQKVRVFHK